MEIIRQTRSAEKSRVFVSLFVPTAFVVILLAIKMLEWATGIEFYTLGLLPRQLSGLKGILFSPLLHSDLGHLFSNAVPFILLGAAMIYFYRNLAYSVFFWVWLLDGIGVWLLGRPVYHIGASGLVYGMAGFVFFSGVLRKNRNLLSLSLAVIAMYGSMIWGIYPVENGVSWEAHLFGLLAGIFCAVYYKPYGPADDPIPEWMTQEEEETEVLPNENEEKQPPPFTIIYQYKEGDQNPPANTGT